ncbi:MAG TPA: MarR family transcriptional regulator [Beijerinckiaceae bacterium]|jgi:DNA-binding MarR family transcriptional regulator|nr:MarR family transcriptional regulator [Beijerinckiaceae bacterium]
MALRSDGPRATVDITQARGLALLNDIARALIGDAKPELVPDFTLRQLAILLTIYLDPPPHTVRGLAKKLGVTKPVVTRALDVLGKQAIIARRRDEADKRNVIVQQTVKGALYVETLGDLVVLKAAGLSR